MNLLQSQKIVGEEVEENDEIVGDGHSMSWSASEGGGRTSRRCRGRAWISRSVGCFRDTFLRSRPCIHLAFTHASQHSGRGVKRAYAVMRNEEELVRMRTSSQPSHVRHAGRLVELSRPVCVAPTISNREQGCLTRIEYSSGAEMKSKDMDIWMTASTEGVKALERRM